MAGSVKLHTSKACMVSNISVNFDHIVPCTLLLHKHGRVMHLGLKLIIMILHYTQVSLIDAVCPLVLAPDGPHVTQTLVGGAATAQCIMLLAHEAQLCKWQMPHRSSGRNTDNCNDKYANTHAYMHPLILCYIRHIPALSTGFTPTPCWRCIAEA